MNGRLHDAPEQRAFVGEAGRDATQLPLADTRPERPACKHGGARPGAGRPRLGPGSQSRRSRVAHRARPVHKKRFPVHCTLRAVRGFASLRDARLFTALRSAIARSQRAASFRITDFSVESNHIHLIAEAEDEKALSKGMRALAIRLTLTVRRIVGWRGAVWADRYHIHELRSPTEYRNAIAYVLNNWRKHMRSVGKMDPCSSAPWFSGWSELAKCTNDGWARAQPGVDEPWTAIGPPAPRRLSARRADTTPLCPVVEPKTWIATTGWRTKTKLGLIKLGECPAAADPMRLFGRAARSDRARPRAQP